jgi:hypothetical protein
MKLFVFESSLEKAQGKEKSEGLPTSFSSSELANVTALEQALKHILDRQVQTNLTKFIILIYFNLISHFRFFFCLTYCYLCTIVYFRAVYFLPTS